MKKGLLEPVRKRLGVRSGRIDFCEDDNDSDNDSDNDDDDDFDQELTEEELAALELEIEGGGGGGEQEEFCEIPTPELQSKDNALAILEAVGDYAGFVIRLCMGMRLPMMLATGFSGRVPYAKYIVGTTVGAMVSLTLQLLTGFLLRNNPALIIASVASISTFPLVVPSLVALLSWINVMYKRWALYRVGRKELSS